MYLARKVALVFIVLNCLGMSSVLADSGLQTEELYPDEYPRGVVFSYSGGRQRERFYGQPNAWYAIYRMPIYPGKSYDVLLAHAGDPSRLRVYALDSNLFERPSGKYELVLYRMDSGSRHNRVYATTIATSSDSSAKKVYLLVEWLSVSNEMPAPVVLQAVSDEVAGNGDCRGMYWAWRNDCQQHSNGMHIESPLQSEKRRNAGDAQPPHPGIVDQDRNDALPFRLLPY
jgi:hypothetical protein